MRKDATRFWYPVSVVLVLAFVRPVFAQDAAQPDAAQRLRFVQAPWGPESGEGVEEARPRYGDEDYVSWIISYSAAYEIGALDQGITLSYNRFLVDDIEWLLEAGLWSFYDRGGEAAYGLSAGIGFRWHFFTRERWTVFADMGIGALGTSGTVPPDGTSFNFMPRAGVGFTREIDENIRLIGGVRWHHISNGRTRGDHRNPSRDAPQLYAGLVIAF